MIHQSVIMTHRIGYDELEYKAIVHDIEQDQERFKDPVFVGTMITRLLEERRKTNELLVEIRDKLAKLEQPTPSGEKEVILSDVDAEIISFVHQKGRVCAGDIQKKFKYKGKNAASARLNSLEKQGLLKKERAGKTVFFTTI